jgi:hypothetical protein
MKAKQKDIKPLREQYLKEQMGLCALCREPVNQEDAVLDHCHKTGYLRAVLHRGCNCYIGAMENNLARNKITPERLAMILANFLAYKHTTKPILHPSHKTLEEKRALIKKRRQRKK